MSKTFTVNNIGGANLMLATPISIPSGFSVTSGFGSTTVAAGGSTTFAVELNAAAVGTTVARFRLPITTAA